MLRQLLFRLSGHLPVRMIDSAGKPYLERYYLFSLGSRQFYLHRFVSGDGDRALHDHPWKSSMAICLAGGYLEHRLENFSPQSGLQIRQRNIRPGSFNRIKANTFHQIMHTRAETWTLFIHGKKIKSWGFLHTREQVDNHGERRFEKIYREDVDKESHHHWWVGAQRGKDSNRASL